MDGGVARYTVFPIKYNNLWDYYKQHIGTFWTVEEVRLSDDLVDWRDKLNDNERYFIKNILAFFAASDGIVNENLITNFYNEITIPEARNFYAIQMCIEATHAEQYSLLIDTYIIDSNEKALLFSAAENIPAVKKKADWAIKWIEEGHLVNAIPQKYMSTYKKIQSHLTDPSEIEALEFLTKSRPSLAQRLVAYVCVEGIFFAGSFCAIYWLKNRGLMPGLSTANAYVSKDENLHAVFAIELYKTLFAKNSISKEIVHGIFKEAVEIEKEFITESLPVSLLGMNNKLMIQYIEYVADRWLYTLGYPKLYNVENPFGFMELISVNTKTNFFENDVDQYRRPNIGVDESQREIAFDDDDF
jgi:ribonucleoside-diphosphate reductase beta chain